MRILKDKDTFTYSGLMLGKDLTRKSLIHRISYSVGCGIGVPLFVERGFLIPLQGLFLPLIFIVGILTYFVGYLWAVLPQLKRELEGEDERSNR